MARMEFRNTTLTIWTNKKQCGRDTWLPIISLILVFVFHLIFNLLTAANFESEKFILFELMSRPVIFRQLFEQASSTYTYILGCPVTKKGVIIDPVIESVERDFNLVKELGIDLVYGMNTHVHADHVTGTGELKRRFPNMKSVLSQEYGAMADVYIKNRDKIKFGKYMLEIRATPGHTNGCVTYIDHDSKKAFTGDAVLIRGCGRTDFQQGNPRLLYRSVYSQILSLPDDYAIYPAHDYTGRTSTTVEEEKKFNPRLTKSEDEFVKIMENLNLPYPKQIDKAVPANMVCGLQELLENRRKMGA